MQLVRSTPRRPWTASQLGVLMLGGLLIGAAACASVLGYDSGTLALDDGGPNDATMGPPVEAGAGDAASDAGANDVCIPSASCPPGTCGTIDDGCHNTLQCKCSNMNDQCEAGACSCQPSCGAAACGNPPDMCSTDGGLLDCGTCTAPTPTCSQGQCTAGACKPYDCSHYQGTECGNLPTQCDGGTIYCPPGTNCAPGDTCNGNSCCSPYTCAHYAPACGPMFSDNCGGFIGCGCTSPQVCGMAGGCCTPDSCANHIGQCGQFIDNCTGSQFFCPCDAGCDGCGCMPQCQGKQCGQDDGCGRPCTSNDTYDPICAGMNQCQPDGTCAPCPSGSGPFPCEAGTPFNCIQQSSSPNPDAGTCLVVGVKPGSPPNAVVFYCCL
jgi:hypothetical protein